MSDKPIESLVSAPAPVSAPVSAPAPAPKRGRKPKAKSDESPDAAAPKAAPKVVAKKAPAKPSTKQVFLEHLLELHCCLSETAQVIDQNWGKALSKLAPYDDGGEDEGGDEEPLDA